LYDLRHRDGLPFVSTTDETDEQIEKRIEENPLGFAREALQREEANEQVQQAYRDVTTRAREVCGGRGPVTKSLLVSSACVGCQQVEQLANSIREVYEMFQDFATLVAQQHEQIDSIETTVGCLACVTVTRRSFGALDELNVDVCRLNKQPNGCSEAMNSWSKPLSTRRKSGACWPFLHTTRRKVVCTDVPPSLCLCACVGSGRSTAASRWLS
jgi:hypothetical protein